MTLTEYNTEIKRAEKAYTTVLRQTGSRAKAFAAENKITTDAQNKYERESAIGRVRLMTKKSKGRKTTKRTTKRTTKSKKLIMTKRVPGMAKRVPDVGKTVPDMKW